ncbi:MAG: hypothetical protein AAF657_25280, partial [Acidobacteriota bacterium]
MDGIAHFEPACQDFRSITAYNEGTRAASPNGSLQHRIMSTNDHPTAPASRDFGYDLKRIKSGP